MRNLFLGRSSARRASAFRRGSALTRCRRSCRARPRLARWTRAAKSRVHSCWNRVFGCRGVEPRSGGSHVNTPTSEHQRRPFFTECREEDHVGIQASSELKQSAESRKSYLGDEPYTEKATHPGRTAVCPPFCPRNARGLPFFLFFAALPPCPLVIYFFSQPRNGRPRATLCVRLYKYTSTSRRGQDPSFTRKNPTADCVQARDAPEAGCRFHC